DIKIPSDDSGSVSPTFPSIKIPTIKISTDVGVSNISKDYIDLPTFSRDITPSTIENIFLLETSNSSKSTYLKYRTLCSVESWCCNNPSHTVWLLVNADRIWDADGLVRRLLRLCSNLNVARMEPKLIFIHTALFGLYRSKRFPKSPWRASHLSDLLRLGLLWKFGGMYTDSDTVCLRSVAGLSNVVGLGRDNHINTAVLHFEKQHPFIKRCMWRLFREYNWQRYITAVESVQREILDSCNVTKNQLNTLPMASPNPCHDFKILTPKLFYPISWMWTLNIFSPKEGFLSIHISPINHCLIVYTLANT
ncbi:unnamed protein product, partial [Meganyctiphanes norvegica]